MKIVKNVVFLLAILIAILFFGSSQLSVTKRSKTQAEILLVKKVFSDCRKNEGEDFDRNRCIYEYGRRNDYPEGRRARWPVDGYGNPIVTARSPACVGDQSCSVYSIGKNGVDECGKGDDVTYDGCE